VPIQTFDPPTREQIKRLVKEEQRLLAQQTLADLDRLRLVEIHGALDRCCDVMRQLRAFPEQLRSPAQPRLQPRGITARDV